MPVTCRHARPIRICRTVHAETPYLRAISCWVPFAATISRTAAAVSLAFGTRSPRTLRPLFLASRMLSA